MYADAARLPRDQNVGSLLSRHAVRLAHARVTAPRAVAMLWLLGRAAAARHGDDALAAAMPPAALAVLRAAPYAVPGLAAGGRVASLGVARRARALLAEAEAYVAAGDEAAAARAFRTRRKRAAACVALGAVPVALVAAAVLALAAATTAPFAAFALPGLALCLVGGCLLLSLELALRGAKIVCEAAIKAAQPVAEILLALFLTPVFFLAAFWRRVLGPLASLAGSLRETLGPG